MRAQQALCHFQMPDTVFRLWLSPRSLDRYPVLGKKRGRKKRRFSTEHVILYTCTPTYTITKAPSLVFGLTFILSALRSISHVHFLMMKGIPSELLLDIWVNSCPNSWRRPCSFLCPHWMARVSKQRLWHARKHCNMSKSSCKMLITSVHYQHYNATEIFQSTLNSCGL